MLLIEFLKSLDIPSNDCKQRIKNGQCSLNGDKITSNIEVGKPILLVDFLNTLPTETVTNIAVLKSLVSLDGLFEMELKTDAKARELTDFYKLLKISKKDFYLIKKDLEG